MKKTLALLLALIMMLSVLSGCAAGGVEYKLTLVNMTGSVVGDVRISPENDGQWGENRLETPLYLEERVEVNLGKIADKKFENGFAIQAFDEYDNSIGSAHSVFFKGGDTLTLCSDGGSGIYVLVNETYEPANDPAGGNPAGGDPAASDPGETGSDYDFSAFEGTWIFDSATYKGDCDQVTIDRLGNWELTENGATTFTGYLKYEAEYNSVYAFNYQNGSSCLCSIEDDGSLYMASYGGFLPGAGNASDPGDGTTQYVDDTCNVRFTCPTWMTIITDGIGKTTDAALVGDNRGGYVTVDNISGEWDRYSGSWDDFIIDYFNSYFDELFEPLYGSWSDGNWELVNFGDPSYQHLSRFAGYDRWWSAISGNYWNSEHDISFLMVALSTDKGNIIKCILLPSDADDSQYQALCNEVVDFDTAR